MGAAFIAMSTVVTVSGLARFAVALLWVVLASRALYFLVKYELYVRSRYPQNVPELTFWSWNKFRTAANLLRPLQLDDSELSMLKKKLGNAAWSLLAVSIVAGLLISVALADW